MAEPPETAPRKQYGLRLAIALMRDVKHLAINRDLPLNVLVEEALRDLLKKYETEGKGKRSR